MHSAVKKTYFANKKYSLQNITQTFSYTKHTCIFHFGICHAANTTNHDSDIQLCRTIKNPNGEQTQMQFESFFREQPRCKMAQNIAWFWCLVFFCFLSSIWRCIWFCNMCVATFYLQSQMLLANILLQKQNDCIRDQPRRQTENTFGKTSDWLHVCEKRRCVRPWSLTELDVKWQSLSELRYEWSTPTFQELELHYLSLSVREGLVTPDHWPNLHLFTIRRHTSPMLTKHHLLLAVIALYWLSTNKYQPLLSFTDQVHSFITS